ncbi:major facilitator family transporter [marine gamma proteobacterium HTCC2143]|jgi:MFS family permease|uniref:Major facilitator family transporter n=1 Tax=marine gamma proteobacterium HTCC2143 TaxID=247633 RepID=A0YFX8_9GAMM|nr:major facilitator family transporter [marine gamma proteobacterium HTCC2143]
MKTLSTISSLLLSTALVLIGQGMAITLAPLRALNNGLTDSLIGLSASAYYLGFIVGCLYIPTLIKRVGHIRCFSVLIAVVICMTLLLDLFDGWQLWIILRFSVGAAVCGLYTVIESWLNSQSTDDSRGRILSVYTCITLSAMTAGQLLINVGPIESSTPFTLTVIFLALAIIPIGLTRKIAPTPVEVTSFRLSALYQRSHSAFAGAILSGVVVGSFWSLGAVFSRYYSQSTVDITWFMTTAIAGGALLQYPIGWLSDRVDRRFVIIGLCAGGAMSASAVALSTAAWWHLIAVFLFGASVMPIYAISLATAADVCGDCDFVEVGSSILMLNALGSFVAPLIVGPLMSNLSATMLFWSAAALCTVFGLYLAVQLKDSRAVSVEDQATFSAAVPDVAPASFDLDPRGLDVLATE